MLTVGDNGPFNDWAQKLRAVREAEGLETTSNGVNETQPGGLEGKIGVDLVVVNIVCDILEDLIRLRTQSRFSCMGRHCSAGECGERQCWG